MLLQKSAEKNIDLNARGDLGQTAFHCACEFGHRNIVEMMVDNAEAFQIDLTTKDYGGRTGFRNAEYFGKTKFDWTDRICQIS